MLYFYQELVIRKTHLICDIVHLPCSTTLHWAICFLGFILYVYNIYTNKEYHLKIIFGM